MLLPGAKPFEPFRERLESSEGGNTGHRAIKALPHGNHPGGRPFSSRPGGRAEARVIGSFDQKASRRSQWPTPRSGSAWQQGYRGVL